MAGDVSRPWKIISETAGCPPPFLPNELARLFAHARSFAWQFDSLQMLFLRVYLALPQQDLFVPFDDPRFETESI